MAYYPNNPNGQATMSNSAPVVVASDQSAIPVSNAGLTELAAAIDTEVQVDVVGALPAGNNNIGDVDIASIAAGDNNIGNVDIASIAPGDNNIGNVDVVSSALPTGASTLSEQQSQTTHLATIAGDTTDIEAAVELIDDAIVTDDAAFTPATTKVMMAGFEFDDTTPDSVNEGDAGAARMSANRNIYTTIRDAAGNERGVNVNASNQLAVSVDNTVAISALPAGTNNIGDVDVLSLPALPAGTNNIGDVDVLSLPALPAGTNNIGDVDVLSIVPGTGATNLGKAEDAAHASGDVGVMALGVRAAAPTERSAGPTDGDYVPIGVNEVGAQWVSTTPSANGGWSVFSLVSAGSTNATNIKSSAGKVGGWYIYNSNAAARKIAFHNASGTPTAGASVYFSIVLPPTSAANVEFSNGIQFSTGIAITTVTGLAANDATAVAANDLIIAIYYK